MFVLFATKPLNDGTKGFRFNFLGQKGLYRKRSILSRGIRRRNNPTMVAFDLCKRTLYLEKYNPKRKLSHFAG